MERQLSVALVLPIDWKPECSRIPGMNGHGDSEYPGHLPERVKGGIVHGCVGQVGFDVDKVKQNLEALVSDLKKAKPASAKGVYLKKITLSTTMGPGIAIDQSSLEV